MYESKYVFHTVDADAVEECFTGIKNGSAGLDGISLNILRIVLN